MPDYYIADVDHPSNNKREGVCIFYSFFWVLNTSYLSECITFEIKFVTKFVVSLIATNHLAKQKTNFGKLRKGCGISNIWTLIISKGQVPVFNSTILNIITNFVPNETIACDGR